MTSVKLCSLCAERPRRSKRQRWCAECHASHMRRRREFIADQERDRIEAGDQTCGPLAGVYFIQCESFIKIGVSADVTARLRQLRTSNPHDVVPLGFVHQAIAATAIALEAELHTRFASHRHRGEWFHAHQTILAYVSAASQGWPLEQGVGQ